jgi:hypothetical protein
MAASDGGWFYAPPESNPAGPYDEEGLKGAHARLHGACMGAA